MRRWRILVGLAVLVILTAAVADRTGSSGSFVRTVEVGKQPSSIAVSAATGRVFVANGDSNTVSVLDANSGLLLRTIAVGVHPGAIATDARGGCVVVANQGGSVSVLDARDGRLLRTIGLHRDAYGAVDFIPQALAVDEGSGRVFITGNGGRVGVLDRCAAKAAGAIDGLPPTASGGTIAVDSRTGYAFVVNSMDPGSGSTVNVLDGRRTTTTRSILVSQGAQDVAVDARTGAVFVIGQAGVDLLDRGGERVARTIPVRSVYGETLLDERRERLFVGTISGGITALGARDGRVLFTRSLGLFPGSPLAEDQRRGRVYVCTGGTILTLDPRDGARRGAIPVRGCDSGMAVDERTGYLFVANGDDPVAASTPWSWLPSWLRQRLPADVGPAPTSGNGSVSVYDPAR